MSPPPAAKRAPPLSEGDARVPATMAEALVHKLGLLIVAGKVKPGKSLGDEPVLLQRYGVSRSVLRDAFKILAGKGMVATRRGVGTRVRPSIDWMMLDRDVLAWHQSAGDEETHLMQLLAVREALEPLAARLAAGGKAASRRQVMTAYRGMEASVGSMTQFVENDTQFHRAILHASGNIFLMANGNLTFSLLARQITMINRTTEINIECLPLHLAVAEAIVAGDPGQADKSMRVLLEDAREATRKAIEEQ